MSQNQTLLCKECGRSYPTDLLYICEDCFGKLELIYDYESIDLSHETIERRPWNIWRYRELLPIGDEPTVCQQVGGTPLIRADRLARRLGVDTLYVKNDAVSFPTLSFKDRVVAIALNKAKEFGITTVGCATTGNLGNSLAAQSVQAGLRCFILMPAGLEQGKVIGTSIYGTHIVEITGNYDHVNRLCTEIADQHGWGFVNINLRPYYGEGSKTYGFEVFEQLGWQAPDHIVVPMAGGSLVTKIEKAYREFTETGLMATKPMKIHGAQAAGCNPISAAVKAGEDMYSPVKPDTIAQSIAIGTPADGYYAIQTIRRTGGWAEDVTDEEIVKGIHLLAKTEGIFTETAGGTTVAVTKKLIEQGVIPPNESIVISITGNGLKTQEAVMKSLHSNPVITPKFSEFESYLADMDSLV